jgi:ankyrin repeat protein
LTPFAVHCAVRYHRNAAYEWLCGALELAPSVVVSCCRFNNARVLVGLDDRTNADIALATACREGWPEVAALLAADEPGVSALAAAVEGGQLAVVDTVLAGPVPPPILAVAARGGRLEIFERLFPRVDDAGKSEALAIAADHGWFDICRFALAGGAIAKDSAKLASLFVKGDQLDGYELLGEFDSGHVQEAIQHDSLCILQSLASRGLEHPDAISLAIQSSAPRCVQFLLTHQPLPQSPRSALTAAIHRKSLRLFEILLESCPWDINEQNDAGNTLLLEAIISRAPEIAVKLLVSYRDSINVNVVNNDGQIAANLALPDFTEVFVELIENPYFNFNAETFQPSFAFVCCAAAGKLTAMKLLAERCSIDAAFTNQGRDALSFALEHGNRPMIEFIVQRFPGVTFPISPIRPPDPQYVLLALELGRLDFDTKIVGRTLLHFAIDHRQQEIFELLINADHPAIGPMASAVLSQVIKQDLPEMFTAILARQDVDLNTPAGFYGLPLTAAIRSNNEIYFSLLITDDRIDISPSSKGAFTAETPLTAAVQAGKARWVRALLERGCKDVNTPKPYGKSPYSIAKENMEKHPEQPEWKEIMELLVKAGADTIPVVPTFSFDPKGGEKAAKPPARTAFGGVAALGARFGEMSRQAQTGRSPLPWQTPFSPRSVVWPGSPR